MQKNVGGYDRIARLVVGPVLVIVGAAMVAGLVTVATGILGTVLAGGALLVGAVFVVTGMTQKCPLNRALGLNTHRDEDTEQKETADRMAGRPN
ncbi:Protein of unknown function [Halopelagius inordinatus]|uniref:Inner membrane protein YgaP-like transmembrane domain-containing protein n=1 Tax=Halopelagius inordinatus TaxID=553467 RepID=A0A1I2M483_9EURY|nr:DUF2892 domain-containing protein [Halopelagius inordinatus]SFF86275.1 Protein of unknown function [Halopelagius inordinatus]